jgi:hypothetical protein
MRSVILPSARKRGIPDEDILHALRNTTRIYQEQGDYELTIAIGPATNGVTLLEVGFDTAEDGLIVIVHTMLARKKYL